MTLGIKRLFPHETAGVEFTNGERPGVRLRKGQAGSVNRLPFR
jgi:hypothetical protein